jgi:hypothetical protein
MEVTFGQNQVPADAVATPATAETPAAPATPATAPVQSPGVPATVQSPGVPATSSGLVLGDKVPDFKDIILPRLNLTQNIGKMKDSFDPGSFVLGQQVVLFLPGVINAKTGNLERAPSAPAGVTILGFRPTRYCEKIAGGVQGLIVNTEDEVRAAGGTLDYKEWELKKGSGMKRFEPLADAVVVVERPANIQDDDTVFVYEVDGKKYALALWAMRGTSYTAAAKRVFFTARAVGCLRKGYPTYNFAVTTREETYPGGNKAWVPVCVPVAKSTPAFLEFAASILNPAA